MKNILVFTLLIVFFVSCQPKTNKGCGEVSARVMDSEIRYFCEKINQYFENKPDLASRIDSLIDIQNQLIIELGGYKGGKSMELMVPCRVGLSNVKVFDKLNVKKFNQDFINYVSSNEIISEAQTDNLKFIFDSYFVYDRSVFKPENIENTPLGYLVSEYLTYQLVVCDIIMKGNDII